MTFFPSVDLCHCWRDVHSRRHHRLLHIYCFRGLEEDPDRKNVLRTAPLPSSDLIYKCNVASLMLNPIPSWTSFLFGDHITETKEAALALDPTIRLQTAAQLLQVLSESVCHVDADFVHFLFFQRPQGRDVGVQMVWVIEGYFLFCLICSMEFTSVYKTC